MMVRPWDWRGLRLDVVLGDVVRALNLRLADLARALRAPSVPLVVRYGTTVTIDSAVARVFQVTATDGVAFTIAKPLNLVPGREVWLDLRNGSGGALGAITWDAVFLRDGSFAAPAAGKGRIIGFYFDGVKMRQLGAASGDL